MIEKHKQKLDEIQGKAASLNSMIEYLEILLENKARLSEADPTVTSVRVASMYDRPIAVVSAVLQYPESEKIIIDELLKVTEIEIQRVEEAIKEF